MTTIEVKVPSIGDYKDVPVIDVLVKPGEYVNADDGLVTLESDKATMDIPAPVPGTVRELKVKVGDRVSEGTVVLTLEQGDAAKARGGEGDGAPAERAPPAGASPTNGPPRSPARATAPAATAPAATAPAAKAPAAREPAAREPPSAPASTPAARPAPAAAGTGAMVEVKVPSIGDYKDVPVIEVLVEPGEYVNADDGLVTLESDKATMDVPAPQAGTVKDVRVKVGDRVSEGSVVLVLEAAADRAAREAPGGAEAAPQGTDAEPSGAATTATPSSDAGATPAAPPRGTEPTATAAPSRAEVAPPAPPRAAGPEADGRRVHASPSVRKLARELGVDLTGVKGSGPRGRILHGDVQGHVKAVMSGAAGRGTGVGLDLLAWPKVDFAKFGPIEMRPLTRIQKLSGPALARNWVMIPHVTQFDEADITELEAFRETLSEETVKGGGPKVTLLAFVVKACVAALKRFPELNASLAGDQLVLKRYFHIGFAADTPNGLVVPVVRDADRKGLIAIAQELADLAARARGGKLQAADIQGGSFSISSLGGVGGTAFTPIINAPEVAILGVSRSAMKPRWDGRAFAPRLVLPLSLSYDHRVVDGALAARFTTFLAQVLGDMRRALL